MDPATWRSLRWLVALAVGLLLVVVIVPMAFNAVTRSVTFGGFNASSGDDEEEEAQPDGEAAGNQPAVGDVPSGPVEDGSTTVHADFLVREGTVRQRSAERLSIREDGDAIVVVVDLIDGAAECVAAVHLEMELVEADPTELYVYAADVGRVDELQDGDDLGDPRRGDDAPPAAVTDGTPGWLRWDLTERYATWVQDGGLSRDRPLALLVAPPEAAMVRFASSDAVEDRRPRLKWQGAPGCGESS